MPRIGTLQTNHETQIQESREYVKDGVLMGVPSCVVCLCRLFPPVSLSLIKLMSHVTKAHVAPNLRNGRVALAMGIIGIYVIRLGKKRHYQGSIG